jgi:hypothetical protein
MNLLFVVTEPGMVSVVTAADTPPGPRQAGRALGAGCLHVSQIRTRSVIAGA